MGGYYQDPWKDFQRIMDPTGCGRGCAWVILGVLAYIAIALIRGCG